MVTILMISAKLVTLDFLKVKVLLNQIYDLIIYVNDVTNKNLSFHSNYIVDAVI